MVYELTDPVTKEKISYHVDKKVVYLLEGVKDYISKRDKDYVMLVDGYEGSGKSTFAIQCGKYVDPSLDLSRICMTPDEFKQAIIGAKKGQCVIYDEAVTGLTAGDSITKVGRILKSMMMQMRQKNLFVIVIMPVIFEFNKYAVLSRARFFFHIYESKGRMGYFVGLNKKGTRLTYLKGKKTHSYSVRSRFNGRFYGKFGLGESQDILYRKKKEESLFEVGEDEADPYLIKYYRVIHAFRDSHKLSESETPKELAKYGITLSSSNVGEISRKVRKLPVALPPI